MNKIEVFDNVVDREVEPLNVHTLVANHRLGNHDNGVAREVFVTQTFASLPLIEGGNEEKCSAYVAVDDVEAEEVHRPNHIGRKDEGKHDKCYASAHQFVRLFRHRSTHHTLCNHTLRVEHILKFCELVTHIVKFLIIFIVVHTISSYSLDMFLSCSFMR